MAIISSSNLLRKLLRYSGEAKNLTSVLLVYSVALEDLLRS